MPSPDQEPWHRPSPAVIIYWVLKFSAPIAAVAAVALYFYLEGLETRVMTILTVVGIVVAFVAIWAILFYSTYVFSIATDGVYINRGILFKSHRMIPYDRIQHINVTRGPLMAFMTIWDLSLYTAGTASMSGSDATQGLFGAEGYIPGIGDARALRDEIWARAKRAREEAEVAAAPPPSEEFAALLTEVRELRRTQQQDAEPAAPAPSEEFTALLDEVREIRRLLEER